MKSSTTAVISLLFVTVAGAYYYFNPEDSARSRPEILHSTRILPLAEKEEISRIEIHPPKKSAGPPSLAAENAGQKNSLVLEKKGGKWRLASPVSYAADPVVSEGLETALLVSTKARRLFREKDWSEYGLGNPAFKIGVGIEPGGKNRVLALGDVSPVAEQIYARWEGEEEYFLVDANLKKAFDKSLYSLREKRIFRRPLEEAAKVHVKTFSGDYELARQKDSWYWLEPIVILGEPAADSAVREILEGISGLYIKEFLDGTKKKDRELGLSGLGPSISVWGKGKDPEVLWAGREAAGRDGFFARRQDEGVVLLVASGNLRAFFEKVEKSAPHPNPLPFGRGKGEG